MRWHPSGSLCLAVKQRWMKKSAMKIIEIENLTHRYVNGHVGIQDVTLSIGRGDFVVIAGANGSGKTTLLRHLNGLLAPTQGSVVVDGVAVSEDIHSARRKVGMVFQDADSQIVGETVFDDVAFGPENLCWSPDKIRTSVQTALDQLGLGHLSDQSPHLLSGGERRRLAIAGVLAMQPDVIILDEPFANLDYPGVRQVLTRIVALHQQGHTIIVSAHDLEKVIAHAQRLVIMHNGRIVADDPPAKVTASIEQHDIRLPCAMRMGLPVESWLN